MPKTKRIPSQPITVPSTAADANIYAEINDPKRFPPIALRYLVLSLHLRDAFLEHQSIRSDASFPSDDDPEEAYGALENMIGKAVENAWYTGYSAVLSVSNSNGEANA